MWTEISTQTCLWAPWLILLPCSGEPPGYHTLLAAVTSFPSHIWSCRVCPALHSLLSHPMNPLCPGPDPFYMSPKRSSLTQEPSIWNSPTVLMVAWSGEARSEGRAEEAAGSRFPCLSLLVCVWVVQRWGLGPCSLRSLPLPHSVDVKICFSYVAVPSSYSPSVGEWRPHPLLIQLVSRVERRAPWEQNLQPALPPCRSPRIYVRWRHRPEAPGPGPTCDFPEPRPG